MKQRTIIELVSFEVVPSIGTKPCLTDKLGQAGLARGTWDFSKRFQTRIISPIFYLDLFHLRDAPFAHGPLQDDQQPFRSTISLHFL